MNKIFGNQCPAWSPGFVPGDLEKVITVHIVPGDHMTSIDQLHTSLKATKHLYWMAEMNNLLASRSRPLDFNLLAGLSLQLGVWSTPFGEYRRDQECISLLRMGFSPCAGPTVHWARAKVLAW